MLIVIRLRLSQCSALQCAQWTSGVGGLLEKLELQVAHMHWWSDVQYSPTPLQCNIYATMQNHMHKCTGQMSTALQNICALHWWWDVFNALPLHWNICTALVRSPMQFTSYQWYVHSAISMCYAVHSNRHCATLYYAVLFCATLCAVIYVLLCALHCHT